MSPYINQKYPIEKVRETAQASGSADANKLDLRNEIQEEHRTHPMPWSEWVFQSIKLFDKSRVLELGGGTGTFWQKNASHLPHHWKILLTDQSMDMIRQAQANLSASRSPIRFLSVDSQSLPFPDERFDAVLAVGLLDLVPNLDQALREVWRVLLPSGQIIATAGGKGHLHELENLLRPFLPEEVVQQLGGQEDRFGLENGEKLLSPHFRSIVRHDYNDQLIFTELSPILDYILSEQAIVWSMPLNHLGEFVQQVKHALAKSGHITVTVRKGVFVAKKKI
jgi:ubiquinone/menaquinone biosynthesis C-methylase UbiE